MCTLECLFSKDEESRSRFFPLRLPKGNLYFSIFVCVTVCVFYIRAAAAARDRAAAAVVGAWPNIWLRHHQTRYFFFSISLSLWKPEGEKLVWWADPLHRHLIQWWPTLRFKPRSRSLTVFSSPQCWKINQKVSHYFVILKMSHFECFN